MNSLLDFRNISLTYQTLTDEITAIENLSFKCENGEFTSIIGPSGCGKTTVLSIIAGLISPTRGQKNVNRIHASKGPTFSLANC